MPRPHRIEFAGAWYLIENFGNKGRHIFNDDSDYLGFLDLLGDISQVFSVEIHAFSLLKDRYALIMHTPRGGLSRAMRHLNGVFTQNHNQTWKNNGSIFQGRYKACLLDANRYLLDAVSYVHALPVQLKQCNKAADYPWTSHRIYLKGDAGYNWLCKETVTKKLGFIKALAMVKLNNLVTKGPSQEFKTLLDSPSAVIGSADFKTDACFLAQKALKNNRSKKSRNTQILTAQEILDLVSKSYAMPVGEIKKSHSGIQNEARSMAVYQLRTVAGLPQKSIARMLNAPNGYTVAKTLQRFQGKISTDPKLAAMAQDLAKKIGGRMV
ncbi:MAG: hypothetical protein HQM16_09305 [Deltaproteobacteria bacterium]|nr:hypothetical protein [Deltaproteobacteria bacterium]